MISTEDPHTGTTNTEQQALDRLAERLVADLAHIPADDIADALRTEHEHYNGRPIRDFIPILVERGVRQRLTRSRPAGG